MRKLIKFLKDNMDEIKYWLMVILVGFICNFVLLVVGFIFWELTRCQ